MRLSVVAMTSRRGFLASLVAALVGVRLAFREVVIGNGRPMLVSYETWTTVRINGRPVRLLRSRKVPPDYLYGYDDGRVVASPGLSTDEIARRMRLNAEFSKGRQWVVTRETIPRAEVERVYNVRNLFDS